MPTYSPVLIDPASNGSDAGLDTGSLYGPFVYNNQLWTFIQRNTGPNAGRVSAFFSADKGATWTAVDDAHALTPGNNATPFFDGLQTVTFAWTVGAGAPFHINLLQFNMSTQKWGGLFANAGSPADATGVTAIWVRPDGSRVVLYSIAQGTDTALHYAVCTGLNVWSLGSTDVGGNVVLLPGWDPTKVHAISNQAHSAMEANGRIHVFFYTTALGLVGGHFWGNRCFYQAINTNNGLGSFFDFPGQDQLNQDLGIVSGGPIGVPVILPKFNNNAGKLVLPVCWQWNPPGSQMVPTIYTGTPLSNPAWTKYAANGGVDPPSGFTDQATKPYEIGDTFFDSVGNCLYWVFPRNDDAFNLGAQMRLIQICSLDPAATWQGTTIADVSTYPAPYKFANQQIFLPSVRVVPNGQIMIGADSFADAGLLHEDRFWFGNFDPANAPGPPAPSVGGANPGPSFTISPTQISYAVLPDPRVLCDVQGQKRCVIMGRKKIKTKVTTVATPMER